MAAADGLASAFASAVADAGAPMIDREVSVLLPLLDAGQVEAGRAAIADRDPAGAVRELRRSGRPVGAVNKRTATWRDYFLTQCTHPLMVLGHTFSRPVEVLAAELGCSKLEAYQVQMRAAAEALPYIESKMPVAVDVSNHRRISLVIEGLGEVVDGGDGGGSWLLDDLSAGIGAVVDAEPFEAGASKRNQGVGA